MQINIIINLKFIIMPDLPIKPPNKRVDELTTEITLSNFELFKSETDISKRNTDIITHVCKELAIALAKIEIYEKLINENCSE